MRSRRQAVLALMVASLLGFATAPGPADAAPAGAEPSGYVVTLGITEGPDPIPNVTWEPPDASTPFAGVPRSDGRPDVTYHDGNPFVVWAHDTLFDHDVAFSRWHGSGWQPRSFLTSSAKDDLDPRLFVEPDGTIHVVWWVDDTQSTVVHRAGSAELWDAPEVLALDARRPTVAVWNAGLHIAFERDADDRHQTIVLQSRDADGSVSEVELFDVARRDRLDVQLHAELGQVWMEWKLNSVQMAYSILGPGGWSAPAAVSWRDSSWHGELDARMSVRTIVIGP